MMRVPLTYPRFDEEALEAPNTGRNKWKQFIRIAGNDTAIEADVNPALALGSGELLLEAGEGGCWRNSIQRHVDNGCHAARGCRPGTGVEALPFRPARFIEVDMGVY